MYDIDAAKLEHFRIFAHYFRPTFKCIVNRLHFRGFKEIANSIIAFLARLDLSNNCTDSVVAFIPQVPGHQWRRAYMYLGQI